MLEHSSDARIRASPAPFPAIVRDRTSAGVRTHARHPAVIFALLSMFFGTLVILLTPPLRGPDEAAHFTRIYGFTRGEILPIAADAEGRKGIFLPERLHRDFEFFETSRYRAGTAGFSYRDVFADYTRRQAEPPALDEGPPVFVLFAGSEGYSPFAYLPYLPAMAVARVAGADFLGMLYLTRFAGLAAMTAIIAYAIVIVPRLGWAFLCIAMLPAALYGRAVISADGGALAYAMVVAAWCLRGVGTSHAPSLPGRALWMALCVLSKPPQMALIVLEAMQRPFRHSLRQWRTLALVILPGVILSAWWAIMTSGDLGNWRYAEGASVPAHEFEPGWKLQFMLAHPLHFPIVLGSSLSEAPELWRQLIGVLGWLDTPLAAWAYPVLTILLVAACLTPLDLVRPARLHVAVVAGLAVVGYSLAVYLICFLMWTPVDTGKILGMQGRYFVAALPAFAIALAALVNRGPSQRTSALSAVGAAALAAAATISAILRVDWGF